MSEQNNDGDYDYDCPPNPKIVLPIIGIIWMLVIVFLLLILNNKNKPLNQNKMEINIDYLKSKGFNCESIREQYKGDFKIKHNRYGEYIYPLSHPEGIIDCELKTQKQLESLYYAQTGINL